MSKHKKNKIHYSLCQTYSPPISLLIFVSRYVPITLIIHSPPYLSKPPLITYKHTISHLKTWKFFPTNAQSDQLRLDREFDGVVANELIKKPPEADNAWLFS